MGQALQPSRPCRIVFAKDAPDSFVRQVRPVILEAVAAAQRVLPLESRVQITVALDIRESVLSYMHGSSGWVRDSEHVFIGVNTKAIGWRKSLKSTVAHELNHTIRHKRMGTRLGQLDMRDTIAFDGLAQCLEEEVCGERPPYAVPLSARQAKKVWDTIKDDLDSLDETFYRRIFFARNDREVPTWAGYRISHMIVSRMKRRTGLGWRELMGKSSREIVGRGLD